MEAALLASDARGVLLAHCAARPEHAGTLQARRSHNEVLLNVVGRGAEIEEPHAAGLRLALFIIDST